MLVEPEFLLFICFYFYVFMYLFIVYLATLSTEFETVSPHVIKHLLFCIYFLYFYSLFQQFIGSAAGLDGDSQFRNFVHVRSVSSIRRTWCCCEQDGGRLHYSEHPLLVFVTTVEHLGR